MAKGAGSSCRGFSVQGIKERVFQGKVMVMVRRNVLFTVGAIVFVFLCLGMPEASAGYRELQPPAADDPMAVSTYVLDNGLTVFLTENHDTPRFYAEIAVRAGSKNDPPETTGLAHYFEHLMFKGTTRLGTLDYEKEKPYLDQIEELYEQHFHEKDPEKRKALFAEINRLTEAAAQYAVPNELDRVYQMLGADGLNAHTSDEETVYRVNLPSNRLEGWAMLEAERFSEPVFRLFPTELETVYEEMNRALDNKQRIIQEAVDRVLFKVHPYGQQPTLGLVEHLKNPSLRNLKRFFETWYVPNNMAVFISGDIKKEEAIAVIDQYFSRLVPKDLPEPKQWIEPPLSGREFVETSYEGEEYVLLAWRTVPNRHPDADALLLVDMILDNAVAGLINLNLNQQQRVRQAGSYPIQHNDYGAQYLWGIPKEGQSLEEVESLLKEQIELVKQGAFEDWLLQAIVTDFEKNKKAALEKDESRVMMLREAWINLQDWEYARQQIERMKKLTREDVIRVAREYFGDGYVAGYRRDAPHKVPDITKPELAKISIDPTRQSAFAAAVLSLPAKPLEPVFLQPERDFLKREDARGRAYYYVRNPLNDLFSFSIVLPYGSAEDAVLPIAARYLEKSGTQRLSAEALKKEWYTLGTTFSVDVGEHETRVTLVGLDRHFKESITLMIEALREPAAPPETLEDLKKNILIERADAKKQAPVVHAALVQYNRYGEESWFKRMLSSEAVRALDSETLHNKVREWLRLRHDVWYTGTWALEDVQRCVEEVWPITEALQPAPPYRMLRVRRPERTEIWFVDKVGAAAQLRIDAPDEPYDPGRVPGAQLFNMYFSGGMAGLVFQELREARALAYAVGAQYMPGYRKEDETLFTAAMTTQNDKTPEATQNFLALIQDMPLSPERFTLAKEALISDYRTGKIGFREVLGTVCMWERLGLTPDPRAQWFPIIQAAEPSLLESFYRAHIAGRPLLISLVGEKSRIPWEALTAVAPVHEFTVETLFVD